MIRQFKHLGLWRGDYLFKGRKITVILPEKHEAWMALIDIVAIEAGGLRTSPAGGGAGNTGSPGRGKFTAARLDPNAIDQRQKGHRIARGLADSPERRAPNLPHPLPVYGEGILKVSGRCRWRRLVVRHHTETFQMLWMRRRKPYGERYR